MLPAAQNNRQWISSEIDRLVAHVAIKAERVRELEEALASLDHSEPTGDEQPPKKNKKWLPHSSES